MLSDDAPAVAGVWSPDGERRHGAPAIEDLLSSGVLQLTLFGQRDAWLTLMWKVNG